MSSEQNKNMCNMNMTNVQVVDIGRKINDGRQPKTMAPPPWGRDRNYKP